MTLLVAKAEFVKLTDSALPVCANAAADTSAEYVACPTTLRLYTPTLSVALVAMPPAMAHGSSSPIRQYSCTVMVAQAVEMVKTSDMSASNAAQQRATR